MTIFLLVHSHSPPNPLAVVWLAVLLTPQAASFNEFISRPELAPHVQEAQRQEMEQALMMREQAQRLQFHNKARLGQGWGEGDAARHVCVGGGGAEWGLKRGSRPSTAGRHVTGTWLDRHASMMLGTGRLPGRL